MAFLTRRPQVVRTRGVAALCLASLLGACFDPEPVAVQGDESTGGDTDGTTAADASVGTTVSTSASASEATTTSPTTTADTTAGGGCSADMGPDPACEGATPYCLAGECVGCAQLDNGQCAAIDPATPACDADSGACVACTDDDRQGCTPQQACIDNACAACTSNSQCESNVCQDEIGECLLATVTVQGTVVLADQLDATPAQDATVDITNVTPPQSAGPTAADGQYMLEPIAPGTLLDVEIGMPQNDPVFVPASLRTRTQLRLPNDTPVTFDPPLVTYAHLAQVAFECGLFPTLDAAIGNGAVNVYFAQRSTVFGRLVDDMGDGVATLSREALQVELDGYINIHNSLLDTNANPAFVCFLERDEVEGRWRGTTANASNDSGGFVVFRVRDSNGQGQGAATVRVAGFDDGHVNLRSTGNIGVVELVRNDDPIPRDFASDVYPIFTTYACVGCHTAGGPPAAVNAGFNADWSLSPLAVWQNLVGPGTTCMGPPTPLRVCTDDPDASLMIFYPLFDSVGGDDPHPVDIFPSLDDPGVQVIREWISQGAQPPTEYDFTEDVYPLLTAYACVGCHTGGGPPEAANAGFDADFDLTPMQVWQNLVGPGTTCPDPMNPLRVCTDTPAISTMVTYPLADALGQEDAHPVTAFANLSDPDLQIILQWIAQGAPFQVTCAHDACAQGEAMNQGCSQCAAAICSIDPYCCNTMWDDICVNEAVAEPLCGC